MKKLAFDFGGGLAAGDCGYLAQATGTKRPRPGQPEQPSRSSHSTAPRSKATSPNTRSGP